MKRIVITGLGIVSPVGNSIRTFWQNLTAGKSGIARLTLFDASTFPVRIAGEVKGFDPTTVIKEFPQAADVRDRKVLLGLAAAREAVEDAGLATQSLRNGLLHVGVGQEVVPLEDLTPFATPADPGSTVVRSLLGNPDARAIQTPLDRTGEILGGRYGLLAGRYTNCSACAAGAQALGESWQMLRETDLEVALAGGTDSILNPMGVGGLCLLRVLSEENEAPERACRPFDATRTGTVLAEGAAFMVLETLEHAAGRSANIYAEILGYSSSMDAFRVSDPDPNGRGAVLSMRGALKEANLGPRDIDCVNAHGTGTPKNDIVETAAIKEVLGKRAYEIPVHAVKSITGHTVAASGAVAGIAAVLTISRHTVPPTINLEHPDPECDLDYVTEGARDFEGRTVLSNSFGFGGQNAALIFGRYP